jgi:hypothetical protein
MSNQVPKGRLLPPQVLCLLLFVSLNEPDTEYEEQTL